jgi:diaminohydroxyphosphoribosylaminopyrimidine deaminase/5-amino-6-(5-phosphoribosylamino)uracil reductase
MALTDLDRARLQEALALAEQAIGVSEPNPRVGCVIGHSDGRVLGRGSTQQAGGPHAELMALRAAHGAGEDVRGATAWVTLEPCAHHGRTPPCCDAMVEAGLARVVVAIVDPFPQVSGAGIARLRAAGVQVDMASPELADAAREVNIGFFSRFERRRPFVRLKVAASMDGRTALVDGSSQWITGEPARRDGHAWRRRAGAVLSGIGTVLDDDPRLDVRHFATEVQPLRVVVDSRLQLPLNARLLAPPGRVLVYAATEEPARRRAVEEAGAEVFLLAGTGDKVDLPAMLGDLALRGINELHVEAGSKLNGSLLRAGLVDELLLYLAPCLLGEGLPIASLGPIDSLDQRWEFGLHDVQPVGNDLRLRLRNIRSPA